MVAITAALAAAVFITVTKIGKGSEPAPEFMVATNTNTRSLQVIGTEPGLDWFRDLRVGGTCTALLNGAPLPTTVGTPVRPGDILSCSAGNTLTVTAVRPNQLLYQTSFS